MCDRYAIAHARFAAKSSPQPPAADKAKLDALTPGGYTPPSGDGYDYVPATNGVGAGKVLTSGSGPQSESWQLPLIQSVNGHTGAVSLTKTDVGLPLVDNTADADKPVSSATATALAGKAALLHTHGNATSSTPGFLSGTDKAKLDGIAAGAQVNLVNSVAGKSGDVTLTQSDVGLGNANNTSDADKPVSTATATAISTAVSAATGDVVRYTSQSLDILQKATAVFNIGAQSYRDELSSYGELGSLVMAAATLNLSQLADWIPVGSTGSITATAITIGRNTVRTLYYNPSNASDQLTLQAGSTTIVTPAMRDIVLRKGDIVRLRGIDTNTAQVESLTRGDGSFSYDDAHLLWGYVAPGAVDYSANSWILIGPGGSMLSSSSFSVGLGAAVSLTGANATAIGASARAGAGSVAVGGADAFGGNVGANNVAIGSGAETNAGFSAVAIGQNALASDTDGVALGHGASAAADSVALGAASIVAANGVAVGVSAQAVDHAVALGINANAAGTQTLALGAGSSTGAGAAANTTAIFGSAALDGGLSFAGLALLDSAGRLYSNGPVKRTDSGVTRASGFTLGTADDGTRIIWTGGSDDHVSVSWHSSRRLRM